MQIKATKNVTAESFNANKELALQCFAIFQDVYGIESFKLVFGNNKRKFYGGSCDSKNLVYINLFYCNTVEKFVRCLMHEMVHVSQHQKGQLSYKSGLTLWNGKHKKAWKQNEALSPWELDASCKSKLLLEKFKKNLKKDLAIF